ncbi:MAG: hypothetical protein LBL35_07710 [Clostridiales bacterium]|nr:hypothetical protein [Clostridiales bacterium]
MLDPFSLIGIGGSGLAFSITATVLCAISIIGIPALALTIPLIVLSGLAILGGILVAATGTGA